MITHAFTCTGPYVMMILAGVKFVENRSGMPVERQGVVCDLGLVGIWPLTEDLSQAVAAAECRSNVVEYRHEPI